MPPTFCPAAPSEGEGAAEFGPRAQEEGGMSVKGKGVSQEMGAKAALLMGQRNRYHLPLPHWDLFSSNGFQMLRSHSARESVI